MKNLKVLSFSILQDNPYGKSLIENLRLQDVEVDDHHPKIIFFPLFLGNKYSILHLHTIHFFFLGKSEIRRWTKYLLFATQILTLKLIGVKVILTVHEWSDKFQGAWGEIHPVWAVTFGWLFDGIITHSDSVGKTVSKDLKIENKNKLFVMPHGNYVNAYLNDIDQIQARHSLDLPRDNLTFLLFGNIYKSKGFLDAIDAFKNLPKEKVFLLIAGKPAKDNIEKEINEMILDCSNIVFVSRTILDNEIQLYLNACDCMLLPYKVFTTSGVTLLAMSFGKACIAPKAGYFDDTLDDAGAFLYDPMDEDGLFNAMRTALDRKSDLAKMGTHNLTKVSQWDWHYISKETLDIYQRCLSVNQAFKAL